MITIVQRFPAQGETPSQIRSGRVTTVETIFAHNPSETDGAYVKLYESETPPDGSDAPIWSAWVGPGSTGSGGAAAVLPVFATAPNLWIAVAAEAGAGLTAPDADFEISMSRSEAPGYPG